MCLPCSPCKYFLPSAARVSQRHSKAYATCRRGNPWPKTKSQSLPQVPISREEPPVNTATSPPAGDGAGGDVCSASLLSFSPEPKPPGGKGQRGKNGSAERKTGHLRC
ncbi:hypothetical protein GQ55_2G109700 [Panicum hallii var. hallii]|uniref:Uncharacterized protein n=1 Tax=Panicum hallii var. hallii TaxID=1504633 RepID=A0A2T7ENQ2_9POAL|nr:hypothetical protein GQ55_2G109700 [Panicum hallii var. hallii]